MEAKKWVFIFWLADAIDVSDFNVKLENLFCVRCIVPGFHSWFVRKKAPIFKLRIVSC